MQLLVLRHAKSSWADEYTDDWERPLTDRGVRDATSIGELLRRRRMVPDLLISSDAVRAQSTAQLVAEASGYGGKVQLSSKLYHARPAAAIEVLQGAPNPGADAIMIVAHNPGLEELVMQLTREPVGLATATLVQIELPLQRWTDVDLSSQGRLVEVWRPGDM